MQRKTDSHQTNTKSGGILWANTNMCGITNGNTEAKQWKDAYTLEPIYMLGANIPKEDLAEFRKFRGIVTINNIVHSQYRINQLSILNYCASSRDLKFSELRKGWDTTTRLSAKSLPSKRMVSTLGVPAYFRARTILGTFWLGAHHQPYPSKRHFFKQQWYLTTTRQQFKFCLCVNVPWQIWLTMTISLQTSWLHCKSCRTISCVFSWFFSQFQKFTSPYQSDQAITTLSAAISIITSSSKCTDLHLRCCQCGGWGRNGRPERAHNL